MRIAGAGRPRADKIGGNEMCSFNNIPADRPVSQNDCSPVENLAPAPEPSAPENPAETRRGMRTLGSLGAAITGLIAGLCFGPIIGILMGASVGAVLAMLIWWTREWPSFPSCRAAPAARVLPLLNLALRQDFYFLPAALVFTRARNSLISSRRIAANSNSKLFATSRI